MKERLLDIVTAVGPAGAQNAMREYLQARVLETLQTRGAWAELAFMGGTALRFLYGTPRFSEDLDFTLEAGGSGELDFPGLMEAVRGRFEREGYQAEAKVSIKTAVNKAFIRFRGLEHELGLSGHPAKTFSVKVEVDTNPPAGAGLDVTIVRRYVTLRLTHHDKASLLAGKVAALLSRGWLKGRDVYDLVWYLSDPTWPEPNEVLLGNALSQSGPAALAEDPTGWRGALAQRLGEAPWDHVVNDVDRFLERPEDVWMLEREAVLGVLRQRDWAP